MRWVLIMLFLPAVVTAQEYRITGTVVDDATGYPLIGANALVTFKDRTDSTRTRGAATDADGGFVVLLNSKGESTEILLMATPLF